MPRPRKFDDGNTKIRTWQFADGGNSVPYVVTSPVPEQHGRLVPGHLCGLMAYNDVDVLEDMNAIAHERGQFLRVYTLSFKGGIFPYPNSPEVLAERTFITLNRKMPVYLRNLVGKIFKLESEKNLYETIGSQPSLINRLWEHEKFQHVTAIGWEGTFSFGRKIHKSLHFVALRDANVIEDLTCFQQPGLDKSNAPIVF